MTRTKLATLSLLLLALAACNGSPQQASIPPSGIQATGSAGTTGGAAAPPAGAGVVSVTRH